MAQFFLSFFLPFFLSFFLSFLIFLFFYLCYRYLQVKLCWIGKCTVCSKSTWLKKPHNSYSGPSKEWLKYTFNFYLVINLVYWNIDIVENNKTFGLFTLVVPYPLPRNQGWHWRLLLFKPFREGVHDFMLGHNLLGIEALQMGVGWRGS